MMTEIFQDKAGNNLACANNCRGVDPNSVIIGGGAVLAATALSAQAFLVPAAGVGLGAAGLGAAGVAVVMGGCPMFQCQVSLRYYRN